MQKLKHNLFNDLPKVTRKNPLLSALNAIFGICLFASPYLGTRFHCYNYTNMVFVCMRVCIHTLTSTWDLWVRNKNSLSRKRKQKPEQYAVSVPWALTSVGWCSEAQKVPAHEVGHNTGEQPPSKQLWFYMRLLVAV